MRTSVSAALTRGRAFLTGWVTSDAFRFRHFRVRPQLLAGWALEPVRFLPLAPDFLTHAQLALRGAQSGDMSVPVPPPPDGVLSGTSDSMEAGEPTLGTAVLGGDCPPGPGPSGWDSSTGCPLALGPHARQPWSRGKTHGWVRSVLRI